MKVEDLLRCIDIQKEGVIRSHGHRTTPKLNGFSITTFTNTHKKGGIVYDELFKQYENLFKEQQKLKSLVGDKEGFSNCLHTQCSSCKGTGIRQVDKSMCIHMISCPCSRCTPQC